VNWTMFKVEDFRPCPFCGKAPFIYLDQKERLCVRCANTACPCMPGVIHHPGVGRSQHDVRERWNRRFA